MNKSNEKKYDFFTKKIKASSILLIIIIVISFILLSGNIKTYFDNENKFFLLNQDSNQLENRLNTTKENLEKLKKEINNIKNDSRYYSHNPSYEEAHIFIKNDTTDENDYDNDNYYCVHFARDVNNNSEEKGIICGYVEINMSSGVPHSIIAFNTTDQDVVFFEPQTDKRVFLEIGKDYWLDCINPGEYKGTGNIIQNYKIYW